MTKFSIEELVSATYPKPAFQVRFDTQSSKPVPVVSQVTLTGYVPLRDRVLFDDGGISSWSSSLHFFKTSEGAQAHIDFAYSRRSGQPIVSEPSAA